MNKDDAREAAIKHAYQEYTYGGELFTGKCSVSRQAFKVIYLAGAASVDRGAIVEKAFRRLEDYSEGVYGIPFESFEGLRRSMDAVIAELIRYQETEDMPFISVSSVHKVAKEMTEV